MKTPADKTVSFVFVSHPTKNVKWRWRATLTFPAGADEKTLLRLEVRDGEDDRVDGTLEFAGARIRVEKGTAYLAYADFVKGKHEASVWLHRETIEPIPGSLTFA